MPTGYTAGVADGSITELADFAKKCAVLMGPTKLRSVADPFATPFVPDPAIVTRVEQCRARLQELLDMSDADKAAIVADNYAASLQHHAEYADAISERRSRYTAMLLQVAKFAPTTPSLLALQGFMIEQLVTSIHEDCQRGKREPSTAETVQDWHAAEVVDARKILTRVEETLRQEQVECDNANAWVREFLRALQTPTQK